MEILLADNLSKTFVGRKTSTKALDGVSFSIGTGEVMALLGKNGAGKTTAVKIIAGLVTPDSGTVTINSADGKDCSRTRVGAVLEGTRNLYWRLTPRENLEYFGVLRGLRLKEARSRGESLLKRFGLEDRANEPVRTLSRGMQQKLAIIAALVHGPGLLVLDEPTLGVDYEGTQALLKLIRELRAEGTAMLLTTHQLEIAEQVSDRTAIINGGRKVADALTDDIKMEFVGNNYVIDFQGELDKSVANVLIERYEANVADQFLSFTGSAEQLYHVLSIMSPTPIMRIARDDFGLSGAYRNYTR